jgi:DNA-binding transcriptional MocR family regulator
MSYKAKLSRLDREQPRSLTGQIVDAFAGAIADGELRPGEKLPPTRELAELAGVNHLTAARAYRRLAELGLVSGQVGKGTFVRRTAPTAADAAGDATGWQLYTLPDELDTYGGRLIGDAFRQPERDDVIPLVAGHPGAGLFPLAEIERLGRAVLAEEGPRLHLYGEIEGLAELRAELARLGRRQGTQDEPDDVVVVTGASQGLTLVARAILRPGDAAACESPSFPGMIESLRNAGASILPIPVDEDGLDLDALETLLERRTIRLLGLQGRLQNPTGRDLSSEGRRRLIELARRHGFFILEDAVYADLRFEGEGPPPLRANAPEHVIHVASLSKTTSAGLRTGWIAASGPVRDRIVGEKRGDDLHSATLTQMIAARFFAEGGYERQLSRAVPFYWERFQAVWDAVEEHLGGVVRARRPLGGGTLWLTLYEPLDERELYAEAIRQGVSFLPGGAVTLDRPARTHLRLAFGYVDPPDLHEGVRRLAAAIRAVGRAKPRREALPIT